MPGWSWQSGEREVQGSLYWLVFSARAAIWLVRLGWRGRPTTAVPATTLGEAVQAGPREWETWAGTRDTGPAGQRGLEGTFLKHHTSVLCG